MKRAFYRFLGDALGGPISVRRPDPAFQKGISLVELLVATALLGLVVTAGFALFEVPQQMRKSMGDQAKRDELHRQSFELFYRAWNQKTNVATILKASRPEPLAPAVAEPIRSVSIRFLAPDSSELLDPPGLEDAFITLRGGSDALSNLLSYRALPEIDESLSFCRFTATVPGEEGTWSFQCPNNTNPGIADLFQNTPITELPIVMIDGRICYVLGLSPGSPSSLRIDTSRNECLMPSPRSSSDHRGMFSLPLLIVYSQDGSFSQAIFDSFQQPRERFGNEGRNYPRQY